MISCWFWLFGFALGKTDNVLSEAIGKGEEGNCVGFVGAEVVLSIFQFITSVYTLSQMFVVRGVYKSTTTWRVSKMKRTPGENVVLVLFIVLGLSYLPIAWITAWNRRCPEGKPMWTAIQHFFYPTFLVVDGVTSAFSLVYARDVLRRLNKWLLIRSPASAVAPDEEAETANLQSKMEEGIEDKKAKSSESKVAELANYFRFRCKGTIAGVLLAVSFFVFQFGLRIRLLSLVTSVFCTLMYVTYALRRIPMLMKCLRDDLVVAAKLEDLLGHKISRGDDNVLSHGF